jgi:hypothetical protein
LTSIELVNSLFADCGDGAGSNNWEVANDGEMALVCLRGVAVRDDCLPKQHQRPYLLHGNERSRRRQWRPSRLLQARDRRRDRFANQARLRAVELEKAGIEFSQDPACAVTSLWIFDQANQAGNKICFSGPGTDALEPYCDSVNFDCVPWDYQAASVWGATTRAGQINAYSTGSCTTTTTFAADEQKNIVCVHNSQSAQQF